jgi:NADH-quinone oxidoreductase subunit F
MVDHCWLDRLAITSGENHGKEKIMDTSKINTIIEKYNRNPEYANEMLLDVQAEYGFLPEDVLRYIGDELLIPQGRLYHIATFYPAFSMSKDSEKPGNPFRKFMKDQNLKYLPGSSKTPQVVLRNIGKVDPGNIDSCIKKGGYKALGKALKKKPDGITRGIKKSGMIGRCGFGTLTGDKWKKCAEASKGNGAYVICNTDEGFPRAIAYRTLVESDPHSIIEGMIIGAYAIGANEGFISLRSCNGFAKAIEAMQIAVKDAYNKGFLGENILGSGFNFNLKLRQSPPAYLNLDLSGLVESLSGFPAEPSGNYIPLVEKGYRGLPTLVSCVETWASIPFIVGKGASAFAKIGPNGTKLVTLTGDIVNQGLAEIPIGMTLREIIDTYGGGLTDNLPLKAIQLGGPSGAFIPSDRINTSYDYESIENAGAYIGTGFIRVIGENSSVFCAMKDSLEFCKDETFGKSVTDREGILVMYSILEKIASGQGSTDDLDILKSVAETVEATSMSNLGKKSAKMVLSVVVNFRDRLLKTIDKKKACI